MKNFKCLQAKAGFSLMEILVVLFIVSTALLGIVSLIIQNIQVQNINRNSLIASELAQEGIELIRNVRDINWRNSQSFDAYLSDGSYKVDYRTSGMSIPITDISQAQIYIKNGFYVHDSGSESGLTSTIFSRQIFISRINSYPGNPLEARSVVTWIDHNRPYRYELQTLLFDWH
jgi:prepilin-type N-terminal cleavage/methylation domain-containing protein